MSFRSLKYIPFGVLLRRIGTGPVRKELITSTRQYYGRKDLFTELSSAMQIVENRMRDMDKFINEVFRDTPVRIPRLFSPIDVNQRRHMPIIKSDEKGRVYHLEVAMPGFQPEDISITLKGNVLTIQGKKGESKEGSSFLREYSYQYTLPEGVNPDTIKSMFQHEILSISAPLPPEEDPKEIPILKESTSKDTKE